MSGSGVLRYSHWHVEYHVLIERRLISGCHFTMCRSGTFAEHGHIIIIHCWHMLYLQRHLVMISLLCKGLGVSKTQDQKFVLVKNVPSLTTAFAQCLYQISFLNALQLLNIACHLVFCIVLYLCIYIALLAVHTNQRRFQCERPSEKRAVLGE